MIDDNAGSFLILDSEIKAASWEEQTDTSGKAAYEVLRVIKGVPLFYRDHYERLCNTFCTIGQTLNLISEQLTEDIKKLLDVNKTDSCNVKIVVSENGGVQRKLIYISKSYYPSEVEADIGVRTGLFRIERQNPNAKLINQNYKAAVNEKIREGGYFEVLLVDHAGRITEGSKSNAFFVRDGHIYTAPGDAVLKGITRKYVFEACKSAGFDVVEQFVEADQLTSMEGAFLSGTSIKVLPIKTIDSITINSSSNPVVAAVRREYNTLLEKYIADNVNIW